MKRRLFKLIVFLLLGAIVNVAVAWGCVFLPELYYGQPNLRNDKKGFTRHVSGFSDWYVKSWGASGFSNVYSYWTNRKISDLVEYIAIPDEQAESALPDWAGFGYPTETYPPATPFIVRIVEARGWPSLALWSGHDVVGFPPAGASVENSVSITNGYLLHGERTRPFPEWAEIHVLPLAPIWPGFAVNMIFYAVLLWMLWLSPFVVRRMIRRKRGRCIKCGYDLRGDLSAGCPECGWRRE